MKRLVAASALLFLSRFLFRIGCMDCSDRVLRKVGNYRGRAVFPLQYICIWVYICKTSQLLWSLLFISNFCREKHFSNGTQETQKALHQAGIADKNFCLSQWIYIHFKIVLSIFLTDKRYISRQTGAEVD